jgi:hypothetical protein
MTSQNFLINPILPLQHTISAPQLANPQHLPHDVTKFLINPFLPLQQTISAPQLTNPQHLPHDVTKFFNKFNLTSSTDIQRFAAHQLLILAL